MLHLAVSPSGHLLDLVYGTPHPQSHTSALSRLGDASSWASLIIHSKARKTATSNPRRKHLLSVLAEKADAFENKALVNVVKVNLASPAPAQYCLCGETAVNVQPTRSALGGHGIRPVVWSTDVAPGPLE